MLGTDTDSRLAEWLSAFMHLFTRPPWRRVLVLVEGAVLAPHRAGPRPYCQRNVQPAILDRVQTHDPREPKELKRCDGPLLPVIAVACLGLPLAYLGISSVRADDQTQPPSVRGNAPVPPGAMPPGPGGTRKSLF